MLDSALAGTGLEPKHQCRHEIDESKLPGFNKRVGKIFTCKYCGEKLAMNLKPVPNPGYGTRIRMSKKDSRRLKMAMEALKEEKDLNEPV